MDRSAPAQLHRPLSLRESGLSRKCRWNALPPNCANNSEAALPLAVRHEVLNRGGCRDVQTILVHYSCQDEARELFAALRRVYGSTGGPLKGRGLISHR
jgi:hypothetical protein